MNKAELYNAAVNVYNQTGQGIPGGLLRMNGLSDALDELISEGLLKSIRQKYSYLPNDEWVCLTKGFCVEETYKDKTSDLSFIRIYKGLEPQADLTIEKALSNVKFKEEYDKWVLRNKEKFNLYEEIVLTNKIDNIKNYII